VEFSAKAMSDIALIAKCGYENLPVCIAKSSKSLSDNDKLLEGPEGSKLQLTKPVIGRCSFVVIICGNIMTMPGLPKVPAATKMKVLPDGRAVGLS
jgi:formate--tetrahydrofolate ligase